MEGFRLPIDTVVRPASHAHLWSDQSDAKPMNCSTQTWIPYDWCMESNQCLIWCEKRIRTAVKQSDMQNVRVPRVTANFTQASLRLSETVPAIHCVVKFYYERRVIQSLQTRSTKRRADERPWERAAWLEMSDHFSWPSRFVRFVLVRRSQAGHLHSRLAHKSCLTAEQLDTASIFHFGKSPVLCSPSHFKTET